MSKFKTHIKRILKFEERIAQQAENKMRKNNFLPISETKPQDIFIAGFPKSGNTWMQNLLTSMLLESTTNISPKLVSEIVPDVHAKDFYKRFYSRMFFKTHHLPNPKYKKVIHLIRDGRDVLVSYHHYGKLNKKKGFSYEEMVLKGEGMWPCLWHEHAQAWLNNPYKAEILTIRYEDLINDTQNEMKKVATFSDIEISTKMLKIICEYNSLKNLRNKVEKSGWDYDKRFGEDSKEFFRKGVIGDYKNEMDEKLVKHFNTYSDEILKTYEYDL
jgi:hypothetical protein